MPPVKSLKSLHQSDSLLFFIESVKKSHQSHNALEPGRYSGTINEFLVQIFSCETKSLSKTRTNYLTSTMLLLKPVIWASPVLLDVSYSIFEVPQSLRRISPKKCFTKCKCHKQQEWVLHTKKTHTKWQKSQISFFLGFCKNNSKPWLWHFSTDHENSPNFPFSFCDIFLNASNSLYIVLKHNFVLRRAWKDDFSNIEEAVKFWFFSFLPAEFSYEIVRSFGDLFGEVHFLNTFEDESVGHHLVTAWKRRAVEYGTHFISFPVFNSEVYST